MTFGGIESLLPDLEELDVLWFRVWSWQVAKILCENQPLLPRISDP
jgi:hypothetical protein